MSDVLDRLLRYWREQGERPAGLCATREEIALWEAKYRVCLPDDLRAYVMRVNGILLGETLEFDKNANTLLPLSAMKLEKEWDENQSDSNFFVIADHCISCFWWTVELDAQPRSTTPVFLSGGMVRGEHSLIASSLADFLDMYIEDAPAMYGSFRGTSR